MLQGLRALDLTDEKGMLCGRILADLGVDVVKVEEPGGSPSRRVGPFYGDKPDGERSLFWFAYNANKRGITLDLRSRDGAEIFRRLVKNTDFVVESFDPGYMAGLGLGYDSLQKVNPSVIVTSITPFGQTGPYADYSATDLQLMALGGVLFISGTPDRPPVRVNFPLAYALGSAEAAVGTLIAHAAREAYGQGQHVDVSIQQHLLWLTMLSRPWWNEARRVIRRSGNDREARAGVMQRYVWRCKDGYVTFCLLGGAVGVRNNKGLAQWVLESGSADDLFKDYDWERYDWATISNDTNQRLAETIQRFFLQFTKEELHEGALQRRILLTPLQTVKELAADEQLVSRQFFANLPHPELGTSLTYPGAFAKSSRSDLGLRRRAPMVGEHNEEVYKEIGIAGEEMLSLAQAGVI